MLLLCIAVYPRLYAQQVPIRMLDLRWLNQLDLHEEAQAAQLWDILHTTATLQGIVNRDQPSLYIRYVVNERKQNVDDYWWKKYRQKGQWLANRDTLLCSSIVDAVVAFRNSIRGVVVYDPTVASTSNIASSVAGIDDLLAIRYDLSPNSLYTQLVLKGPKLPVRCWLVNPNGTSVFTGQGKVWQTNLASSGSCKIDPYLWFMEHYLKKGKCNTHYAAYYIDQYWLTNPTRTVANHHQLTNHDYFVSKKGFFFDLSPWDDEAATDDPQQTPGLDRSVLQQLLRYAYQQNKGEFCYIGGFPSWAFKYTQHAQGRHPDVATEWEFSRIISAYNAFKDADAIGLGALANASFWQHFPLQKTYPQAWVSRETLKQKGLLNADGTLNIAGKQFLLFYVGDYDSSSWITQTTPYLWDDPNRGSLPLMWCISPVLAERVPMVMHNYRTTATNNDYFAAADNGAGYLLPGMLQEPRPISGLPSGLDAWKAHCLRYYKQWGLSITGFVIDGEAPGLNTAGLDCYAAFSPNGIVPQKVPLTLLHGYMPVLRADYDITDTDPQLAAKTIEERITKRPIPFHWFRAILKSPTWYKEVHEQLQADNPAVTWLDGPTFFELYRIYLEQHPDAANGNINMP
ncbi:GxGYxYP family putative glycoside hydrolase [Olivibacter ginsenosidimutans]|uniref:GxGYxYP family putative glycoside hydrolase n=2 Tax=Olivibacter ginsenosidimutans TaxID=1176537 RepID=A0ABP9BSY0_9SPHI